jgi:hypothetical protein
MVEVIYYSVDFIAEELVNFDCSTFFMKGGILEVIHTDTQGSGNMVLHHIQPLQLGSGKLLPCFFLHFQPFPEPVLDGLVKRDQQIGFSQGKPDQGDDIGQ